MFSMTYGPSVLIVFHNEVTKIAIKQGMMKTLQKPIWMINEAKRFIIWENIIKISKNTLGDEGV